MRRLRIKLVIRELFADETLCVIQRIGWIVV